MALGTTWEETDMIMLELREAMEEAMEAVEPEEPEEVMLNWSEEAWDSRNDGSERSGHQGRERSRGGKKWTLTRMASFWTNLMR